MALVSLQNINLSFTGVTILENISLQIEKGQRICLLGRNGTGKSSLMKTIAGVYKADSGFVQKDQDIKIAYFTQEIPQDFSGPVFSIIAAGLGRKGELLTLYNHEERLLSSGISTDSNPLEKLREEIERLDGWNVFNEIARIATMMEIDTEWEYESLSGGQKRRVILASSLVSSPDVLLLDEPTNHLDVETIDWLEEFLLKQNITMVFVTHDRMLLRRLATRIIELDRGKLFDWSCDYDTFLARKEELLNAELKDWERFDKKLATEEVWIRKGIQARRTRNEGRVRALKKMREERKQRRLREGKAKLEIQLKKVSGRDVLQADNISFGYDDKSLIKDFSMMISRGDKIGIAGPNGCGKTTLVNLLLGKIAPHSGEVKYGTNLEVAYYDQLRNQLDDSKTVWENVTESGDTLQIGEKTVHVMTYLQNFLFSPERARTRVSVLSGGERNRVLLAKLFSHPANLIVMDEPTNDLDIETLELLEEQLNEFPGTALIICHDRTFLNNVATSTIVFAPDQEIKEIVGGYDDWIKGKKLKLAEQNKSEALVADSKKGSPRKSAKESKRRLNFNEKRELEGLPEKISQIEKSMEEIQKILSDPSFYKSGKDLGEEKLKLENYEIELFSALERWEELEEFVEKS